MSFTFYHLVHLICLVVLLGYTFFAFAGPPETRKRVLMITGIAGLLMLVSGFGMLQKLGLGFPGWAIVKLICWLGLGAIGGMAYKRREQRNLLMQIALGLAIVAVIMVELKPF